MRSTLRPRARWASRPLKAAKLLGIPVAAGFHSNFHEYVHQYRLAKLRTVAMAYLRGVHRWADVTLVPTEELRRELRSQGYERIQLMGRGVDTRLFRPEKRDEGLRIKWGARFGTPVALVVGRLAPEKNMTLAIECFRRMREAYPDVRCVIVGDGPLRRKLEQEHSWIHFAGFRQGQDLALHYASADVLLFPARPRLLATFSSREWPAPSNRRVRLRRRGTVRPTRAQRTQGTQRRPAPVCPPRN